MSLNIPLQGALPPPSPLKENLPLTKKIQGKLKREGLEILFSAHKDELSQLSTSPSPAEGIKLLLTAAAEGSPQNSPVKRQVAPVNLPALKLRRLTQQKVTIVETNAQLATEMNKIILACALFFSTTPEAIKKPNSQITSKARWAAYHLCQKQLNPKERQLTAVFGKITPQVKQTLLLLSRFPTPEQIGQIAFIERMLAHKRMAEEETQSPL